jgi:hypothetical protein
VKLSVTLEMEEGSEDRVRALIKLMLDSLQGHIRRGDSPTVAIETDEVKL